ncbi:MAG: hypothetical protein J4N98_10355, partial [Chloroflexi bacterium]|nr:hypothetical protein [Chloroflexota bacterium]
YIIAEGTPEEVANTKRSQTGAYLRKALGMSPNERGNGRRNGRAATKAIAKAAKKPAAKPSRKKASAKS